MSVWTNWIGGQLILQFFDQGLNSEVWEGKKQVPSPQIEGTFLVSHLLWWTLTAAMNVGHGPGSSVPCHPLWVDPCQ